MNATAGCSSSARRSSAMLTVVLPDYWAAPRGFDRGGDHAGRAAEMLCQPLSILAAHAQRNGAVAGVQLSNEPALFDEVWSWSTKALKLGAA